MDKNYNEDHTQSGASHVFLFYQTVNFSNLVGIILPTAIDFASNGSVWLGASWFAGMGYSLSIRTEGDWVSLGNGIVNECFAVAWMGSPVNKFIVGGYSWGGPTIGYSSDAINWNTVPNSQNIIGWVFETYLRPV